MDTEPTERSTGKIFGAHEWSEWFDRLAMSLFGMTGSAFETAYLAGSLAHSGPAQDLGAMIQLIHKIKQPVGN